MWAILETRKSALSNPLKVLAALGSAMRFKFANRSHSDCAVVASGVFLFSRWIPPCIPRVWFFP